MYDIRMTAPLLDDDASAALKHARGVVASLQRSVWQPSGSELPVILGELDALGSAVRAAIIAVTAEALSRGEVRASQSNGTVGWLREHAPSLRQGGAKPVADCAELLASRPAGQSRLWHHVTAAPVDDDTPGENPSPAIGSLATAALPPTEQVCRAILTGTLTPPVALTVLTEMGRLAPRLQPEAHPTVTDGMITLGRDWGAAHVRRLRPRLLAQHGLPGQLQADQDTLARHITLTTPIVVDGLTTYQLTLDPISAATMEAAIGPLAAPTPHPDTGERDLRPAGRRRAEALIEVCRRATAAGGQLPGAAKTALFITVDYDTLRTTLADTTITSTGSDLKAGTVVGTPADGILIAPDTIRRLACDAELIPAVLGNRSDPLDLGTSVRLFTKTKTRALWLRDRHCSFPGCHIPAHWCDAHHLTHWADGGTTNLDNATLLCARHHTVVHRDRLTARVTTSLSQRHSLGMVSEPGSQDPAQHDPSVDHPPIVDWDLTPGSYDRALRRRRPAA